MVEDREVLRSLGLGILAVLLAASLICLGESAFLFEAPSVFEISLWLLSLLVNPEPAWQSMANPDTIEAGKLECDNPLIPKEKSEAKSANITRNPYSNSLESTVLIKQLQKPLRDVNPCEKAVRAAKALEKGMQFLLLSLTLTIPFYEQYLASLVPGSVVQHWDSVQNQGPHNL